MKSHIEIVGTKIPYQFTTREKAAEDCFVLTDIFTKEMCRCVHLGKIVVIVYGEDS